MAKANLSALVRLDLNNPVFQGNLLTLQKPERHAALDALNKIRQLTWEQVYRDAGLKWEKISSVTPPAGVSAICSLRTTQSRRATRLPQTMTALMVARSLVDKPRTPLRSFLS